MEPGHFWPQGHNLNKLGRGALDDATHQISRPCGFRDFFKFPYISLCKTCDPWDRFIFGPTGII